MPNRQRRRAAGARREGRRRSLYLAHRIGIGLADSRRACGFSQEAAAVRAGVSQSTWSRIERGIVTSASPETLASCAAAVDTQIAAFIEARSGADLPRDIVHLRGQQSIIASARRGGWLARAEYPIDPMACRSRSIDVYLERSERREIAVVELFDFVADAGDAMRGLADKVAEVRAADRTGMHVQGLFVLRATRRNRELVGRL